MNLIPCPDCGRQLSPRAVACPQCGAPVAATVIEATGKKWKRAQLLGALVMVLGMCVAIIDPMDKVKLDAGIQIAVIGLVALLAARTGAWWNHG